MKTFRVLTEEKGPYNNEIIKTAIHNNKQTLKVLERVDADKDEVVKILNSVDKKLNVILKREGK